MSKCPRFVLKPLPAIAAAAIAAIVVAPLTGLAEPRAVISSETAEPHVAVSINRGPVQRMLLPGYDDVMTLHGGRNAAVVTWDVPVPVIEFRITYSTSPRNAQNVLVVRADAKHDSALRRAGSRTYTFIVPR